ncbi:MAG: helix-turn-helix domain-containing protein [Bacteroidota bacterium]
MKSSDFATLFVGEYLEDSIKVKHSLDYIRNSMLSSQDLSTQYWGNYALAYWYNYKQDIEETINYANKLYEIAQTLGNEELKLSALINKGIFFYDQGKYKESMECYLQAIQIAKKGEDIGRQLAISHNIALLKIEVNDYQGAVDLLQGTLHIIEQDSPKRFNILEVSIYIALTKSYVRLENYVEAIHNANEGIKLSDQYNDEGAKAYLYNFLGETNIALQKYDKATMYLEKAHNYAIKIKAARSQIPFINLNKAKVLYYTEDYATAIQLLKSIEKGQERQKTNFFSLEDMYEFLGKSYKAIKNTGESLLYFEKTNEVYTQNDKEQNEIGLEIIKKYDLQSLKDELSRAEKKTQKTRTLLYVSIFLALAIIAGILYFYKKREKENQKKFTALLQSLEEEKEKRKVVVVDEIPKEKITKAPKLAEKTTKVTTSKEVEIIDETKAKLLKKLEKFEDKELFLSKNSSLNEVAKKLKTNTSYLSKLINAHKGKSFTVYITDLRVDYAIRRLKEDKKFRSYTIDSIAREIGFNRSESFSRAFKNKTGLYPSYYIKKLDSQNIE